QTDLSHTLRSVLPAGPEGRQVLAEVRSDPQAHALVDQLAAPSRLVVLARRFHNDQVLATRASRSRRRVRWFRLAGHAPEPSTVDFDDLAPEIFSVETGVGMDAPGPSLDPAHPRSPEDDP